LNAVNRFDDETEAARAVKHEALESVVLMLSPIVPHISHALWQELGHDTPLLDQAWPQVDASALELDLIQMVVQVNGKLRARISVPSDADKSAVEELAMADENVQRFIDGHQVRKTIVVPGRLVNIVV
ncbi:MAG: class I tRNA ligase family protein, partial [Gammaproteobacteria bacterium]|nr:class I tRNA ligase family protein [Gammaproteobacteria bacterium]